MIRRKLKHSRRKQDALAMPGITLDGTVWYRRGWALSIPKEPGVYLIHDLRGVLYVGRTRNLLQRFEQHYHTTHSRLLAQAIARPVGLTWFSWRTTTSAAEQEELERELIRRFQPPCNQLLYEQKGA